MRRLPTPEGSREIPPTKMEMTTPAARSGGEGQAAAAAVPEAGGPEIAFFDVETSVPQRAGQGYALLEFGAILVCPQRLVVVGSYATLVRPADLGVVSAASVRCNGITRDAVAGAPGFRDVADAVYSVLHGRVWAGHNIVRFDSARIREAFAEIGRPPPEPKGMIDTLPLLTQKFGRRAGDMKMASLANYFGLGRQSHRSLDDVKMNLEVLKYCATVLFLEASLPGVLTVENLVERAITRSQANGAASPEVPKPAAQSSPDSSKRQRTVSRVDNAIQAGDNQQPIDPATNKEPVELISNIKEMTLDASTQMDASSSGFSGFLEPDDVSIESIQVSVPSSYRLTRRSSMKHKGSPLQLCCAGLQVQFGVSSKYLDSAGRPKLNILVDIPDNLSKVLEFCDGIAQRSSQDSGSTSEWRPLIKKYGYVNHPTVRLHIPIIVSGEAAIYGTDIYQKEASGSIQKLDFSKVDVAELDPLFVRGNMVDAFFSLELYDYEQNAGIRLVAKKLVVHSK
ncbi:protein NEN1-like [Oryza brachyantha]|uniref:protein NEN1-like n=1 Tax=Oryza brachyantha TaxID=4533 RepID=UPI001ADC72E5|nr:protein NEN1-like [Oryza brachyantha]